MSYPGNFDKCLKQPKDGGLSLPELRVYAESIGVYRPKDKNRQQLCKAIGKKLDKEVKQPEPAGCQIQTTRKYTARPSPPFSAKDCPGRVLKGNDGNFWVSKLDPNNIYRWVKWTPQTVCKLEPKLVSQGRPGPPYYARNCPGAIVRGNDKKLWVSKKDSFGTYRWYHLTMEGAKKGPSQVRAAAATAAAAAESRPQDKGRVKIDSAEFVVIERASDISPRVRKIDYNKMKKYCDWLAKISPADLSSPLNRDKIKEITFFTREIISKYDLFGQERSLRLEPGFGHSVFEKNCQKLLKYLETPEIKQCIKINKLVNDPKRPAPPYLALDCPGYIQLGNDGKFWISRKDTDGRYKWFPMK